MNAAAHQITGCIINQTMPGDCVFPGKGAGHDIEFVMPAIFGASMAGVAMRFVFNGKTERAQAGQLLTE